ncbi:MAG TPA: type II toxin-antitoxin system ParD family antitoxin [Caulobacteraceae bacterium]
MASMNISLPDLMRDWIRSRIETGRYANVSDYVRDLIRRDQTATSAEEGWLEELDASVERGVADSKAGRMRDAAEVFDRLEAKYAAMAIAPEDR